MTVLRDGRLLLGLCLGLLLVAGGTISASENKKDPDKPSLIGVPIPIADPTIGYGLAAAGLYTLKMGGSEKPSTRALESSTRTEPSIIAETPPAARPDVRSDA